MLITYKQFSLIFLYIIFLSFIAKAQSPLYSATLISDLGSSNNIGQANTSRNLAVDASGNIGVVYVGSAGLRFAKSKNRGQSFLPSIQLSQATSGDCEVSVADNGNIYVIFSNQGNLQLFTSLDGGATFSSPNNIGTGSTPHIASYGSNVYIVPQQGSPIYRNANNGIGAFLSVNVGSWVFSDIRVDNANGDVYMIADNPTLYMYRSTNSAVSFVQIPISGAVFYSSYTITTGSLGKFIYVGGNGNNGYRIDFSNGHATPLTLGQNFDNQGRTLTSDEFGNFVDGYAATANSMALRVSNDKGVTFGSQILIANSVTHNIARSSSNQDIDVVYQGTDGNIYLNVYNNLLFGLTTSNVKAFYCAGNSDVVTYSSLGGTMGSDNAFNVQLSDANRSFSNPVTIGTVVSSLNKGTINFTIPTNTLPGNNYRIRVVSTNSAQIGADNGFDISVNPIPVAQITASSGTTICPSNPVLLASSVGSSYLWSTGATTNSIIVNVQGTYTVAVSNGCGQSATSSPVSVNVLSKPIISASGPLTFCSGGSVQLSSTSGSSYLWSTGEQTQFITAKASGTYTVNVVNANSCFPTSSSSVDVTVNQLPTVTVNASGPTIICPGNSILLNGSVLPGSESTTTYTWLINNNPIDGAKNISYTASATADYSLNVSNSKGCSATSNTINVTIGDNTPPVVSTKPFTLTLDANGNGSLLTADINNGSIDNCGIASYYLNKQSFNYSNIGSNTVTFTVTDNSGNSASGTAIVTVLANGLNAYGQLVTDGNAQTNQYGAKASGKAKTQYGQVFGSSNISAGGLSSLSFITYNETGVSPAIPAQGAQLSTGTVPNIDNIWGLNQILNSGQQEHVQVHFTGNIVWPGIAGINKSIKFYDQSDDGFKMFINNSMIIDNYIDQGINAPGYNGSGTISLVSGNTYPVDIWYYNNGGPSGLRLLWDIGDGNGTVIVPAVSIAPAVSTSRRAVKF